MKQAEELRKQVKELTTKEKRLKTIFQDKITEFRDTVIRLTGYRVDLPQKPPMDVYELFPPYLPLSAHTRDNVLSFRSNSETNQMELLGTPFTIVT